MRIFEPESALELQEWVRSHRERSSEDGVPAVTGAAPEVAPGGLTVVPRYCLSTRRFSEVEDFRPRDLTIEVGSGMRLATLARLLHDEGLWLPLAGQSQDRSVGGWIAAAPASPFDACFGPVRRHLLACRLLLWDGRSTSWGRPVMKNVAGYEVPKLVCGSRARLGIVTHVTLRLWPRPRLLRQFALRGETLREPVAALAGAPRFEGILWRSRAGGGEPATVHAWLAGGPASVSKRTSMLESWAKDHGISVEEQRPESEPVEGAVRTRDPRPGTSAAYRITFGRRYLTAGLKDLGRRLAGEMDPWKLEAYPATGVVRLVTHEQSAAGRRHAPAWLTTLADAGRVPVPEPALETPLVRIERGGEAEHEAARRLRSTGARDIEARWLAAFGGVMAPWQADYL